MTKDLRDEHRQTDIRPIGRYSIAVMTMVATLITQPDKTTRFQPKTIRRLGICENRHVCGEQPNPRNAMMRGADEHGDRSYEPFRPPAHGADQSEISSRSYLEVPAYLGR